MPRPPNLRRKLLQIATKSWNSRKFSPLKVSCYAVCYTHTCKCAHRRMYAHTHTHVHTQHMHIYTHTHMHTRTYKHIHMCMLTYICTNNQWMEPVKRQTYTHANIHMYTHIGMSHTHTHTYLIFIVCCHGVSGRTNQHTGRYHFILFPTSKDWCAGLNHWQASRARVGCREREMLPHHWPSQEIVAL